jgi:hypothetical protein
MVEVTGGDATSTDHLIQKARHRQRARRWIIGTLIVAVCVAVGTLAGLWSVDQTPGTASRLSIPPRSAAQMHTPAPVSPSNPFTPMLDRPYALAAEPNGDVLVVNEGTDQILEVSPTGSVQLFAGSGRLGNLGNGGLAIDAELNLPAGIAVGRDGTAYLADSGNNEVREITPGGVISAVPGGANIADPQAVAVDESGNIYVADKVGIQVIAPDGRVSTVVAGGPASVTIGGAATYFVPTAIAVDRSGDIYAADLSPRMVIEFAPNGSVIQWWPLIVVAGGLSGVSNGNILVDDYGNWSVDEISAGQLSIVMRFQPGSVPGLTSFRPVGVAAGATGEIFADDNGLVTGASAPTVISFTPGGPPQIVATNPKTR